jgi:hypothetical protein
MFETRWIEPTRRNQVKSTSEQNLRITIIKLWTAIMGFSLWFALIRKCKNYGPQLSGMKARTCSLKRFSHEN